MSLLPVAVALTAGEPDWPAVQARDVAAAGARIADAEWVAQQAPRFACSDADLDLTWWYRWWLVRQHLTSTPDGLVFTEFLPRVRWSRKHNTIVCAAGHHLAEARWLHDRAPAHGRP